MLSCGGAHRAASERGNRASVPFGLRCGVHPAWQLSHEVWTPLQSFMGLSSIPLCFCAGILRGAQCTPDVPVVLMGLEFCLEQLGWWWPSSDLLHIGKTTSCSSFFSFLGGVDICGRLDQKRRLAQNRIDSDRSPESLPQRSFCPVFLQVSGTSQLLRASNTGAKVGILSFPF